jgi:hypothetical protein
MLQHNVRRRQPKSEQDIRLERQLSYYKRKPLKGIDDPQVRARKVQSILKTHPNASQAVRDCFRENVANAEAVYARHINDPTFAPPDPRILWQDAVATIEHHNLLADWGDYFRGG